MNILREVRRGSNKSMPVRIILLVSFCVIFVVTTYAWFSTQKDVKFQGLTGYTTEWDVSYYVKENEILENDKLLKQEELRGTVKVGRNKIKVRIIFFKII